MKQLIERLKSNWTWTRILFVSMGSLVIIQSTLKSEWFGVLFGAYFVIMGVFKLGCASGVCVNDSYSSKNNETDQSQEVEYEEIK